MVFFADLRMDSRRSSQSSSSGESNSRARQSELLGCLSRIYFDNATLTLLTLHNVMTGPRSAVGNVSDNRCESG